MIFDSWADIGRTLLVGPLVYLVLIVMLRVSGKRSLSKMNAFDFVVTVALGSTLASTLLSKDVSLAESVTAFTVLLGSQFVITFASVRSERFQGLVKAVPTLLYHRGTFLRAAMRRERVSREEVLAAARAGGFLSLDEVAAVVLETDGSFAVMGVNDDASPASALANVRRPGPGGG